LSPRRAALHRAPHARGQLEVESADPRQVGCRIDAAQQLVRLAGQAKPRHASEEFLRALTHALGDGGGFLGQRGVLLGHGSERLHRGGDGAHPQGPLPRGLRPVAEQLADGAGMGHQLAHGVAGVLHHRRAVLGELGVALDQRIDLTCGGGRALRQRANLAGHHRKPTPVLAGTGGLDSAVEGQDGEPTGRWGS